MNYNEELLSVGRYLKANDHFLVVNHVNPDGDATGALLAMGYILKSLGKTFVLANEGATPAKFMFGNLSASIKNLKEEPLAEKFKQAIALDCGDFKRLGSATDYFSENVSLLNIDHHPTNDRFGSVNLVHTTSCATCEILYDLACTLKIEQSKDLAVSLYMGILTDTGGFRYSNTNAGVFQKAGELLHQGVSPAEVAERCLETITPSYFSLLQHVLPTLSISFGGRVATLSITIGAMQKSKADLEDMEGIVNYARNIEGVEVGILLKQIDTETVKISLRSRRFVDVSLLAQKLGGGGHARAAGCTFKGSLAEAAAVLEENLLKVWNDA